MNLVVDIGNTRTKYAIFDNSRLIKAGYEVESLFADITKWKIPGKKLNVFISGSGEPEEGLIVLLKEQADFWLEADALMELPLTIDYKTPQTLGFDRIAICVGARSLFPDKPLLVIDSGTAITFNYVDVAGRFKGGNISPGLEIRFKGLYEYTKKLPYVSPSENYGGVGKTTEEAIRNGVMDGMLFEVKQYIFNFLQQEQEGQVVITGGNSIFLRKILREQVYFCDILGFIGLNEILDYTKKV